MTRLYHPKDRCENCGKLGGSGWLYRCTVDREPLIIQNKEEGLPVGCHLARTKPC